MKASVLVRVCVPGFLLALWVAAVAGCSSDDGGSGTGGSAGADDGAAGTGEGGAGAAGGSGGSSANSGGTAGAGGTAQDGGASGEAGAPASSGGTAASGGSGGSGPTPSGEVAACAAMEPNFEDPASPEYVQWNDRGTDRLATPPAGGAYAFNGFVNVATYTGGLNGSLSLSVTTQQEVLAAGTYHCHTGDTKAQVTVNSLSVASSAMPDTDCAITFDDDVEDGGRLKGSFWAFYAPSDWPVETEGGCVYGRFDVSDAAD